MLPLLTTPLALTALAALPALAALYWLRNRYRRQPVSSLMLWTTVRESGAGGWKVHRLERSLLLPLELLAVLLLVGAAAGPQLRLAQHSLPLVVVLDDSYSMRAGGPESARELGRTAILDELRTSGRASVRFVLAGERPQLLDTPAPSVGEAADRLTRWQCRAPTARLDDALAFAAEIGGQHARLLVVTDHEGKAIPEQGRLQWWAFGRRRPNVTYTSAVRTPRDGPDRCLFEIANLWPEPRTTTLTLSTFDPAAAEPHEQELRRTELRLEGNEARRIVLELKEGTRALRARLSADDLDFDNEVILPAVTPKSVHVELRVVSATLRPLVEQAFKAIPGVVLNASRPDLIVSDNAEELPPPGSAWLLRLLVEDPAEAFTGPFVVDQAHPLADGLALRGVVWGAGTKPLGGTPVILAGNVPLLTDTTLTGGRHSIALRLRPDLSTLPTSPNWPILIWNLVAWNAAKAPGLSRTAVRLGEEITLTLPTSSTLLTTLEYRPSDGAALQLPVHDQRVLIRAEQPGLGSIKTADGPVFFAVNVLNKDESDLTGCGSGRWGTWLDETTVRLEYQDVGWLLALLALGVLTLHLSLQARATRGVHV